MTGLSPNTQSGDFYFGTDLFILIHVFQALCRDDLTRTLPPKVDIACEEIQWTSVHDRRIPTGIILVQLLQLRPGSGEDRLVLPCVAQREILCLFSEPPIPDHISFPDHLHDPGLDRIVVWHQSLALLDHLRGDTVQPAQYAGTGKCPAVIVVVEPG